MHHKSLYWFNLVIKTSHHIYYIEMVVCTFGENTFYLFVTYVSHLSGLLQLAENNSAHSMPVELYSTLLKVRCVREVSEFKRYS